MDPSKDCSLDDGLAGVPRAGWETNEHLPARGNLAISENALYENQHLIRSSCFLSGSDPGNSRLKDGGGQTS